MKTSFFQCFSSKLKTALEEIVSGQHNDEKCKEFQEIHSERFGVAPPQCKFKENPEEIPKLIEKVVIVHGEQFEIEKPKPEIPKIEPTKGFRAKFKNFLKRK